ncbi:MAG: glycogen/starch/alpha-glucan phosphorylase [Kiritimatiellae bacterium]|nr:glycogen/starch/alpha-glucan phosphorylase [Kiritimatiellia bacterium]MCO5062044.1 glycogen/starch/alpha-glucan phosphorylase [Kiritimatiellia bacterium]MCO5069265.1 glycogen/starch/alpha-glucan phosphorylase [Kiritimatiellia bacterium]
MATTTKSAAASNNKVTPKAIRDRMLYHLTYTRCKDWRSATDYDKQASLAFAIRDLAMDRMIATQRTHTDKDVKRVYYLSMEFLLGRLLENNIAAVGVTEAARKALKEMDIDLDILVGQEVDAGLGNGGLGRLAACFLDSLASMEYPGYGYGLRYEHGLFRQEFENGWQKERPDDWLKFGNPWEVVRPEYTVPVLVYGRIEQVPTVGGGRKPVWVDWQMLEGVPYDMPVIGFDVNTVNILRLWSSRATEDFRLDVFNQGDYVRAVEEKNWAETITKVLYPSDATHAGKELRLIQEYFLVTCAIRDIIRRYRKKHSNWGKFADKNAVQLNDTHPALSVAELMRYFIDETDVPWDKAWEITVKTMGYTNHTLLPEALEKWPVQLMERVLPRHLQIIYEINARFLQQVEVRFPNDLERVKRMSLVEEGENRQVRMANLAIVGSHKINGVSALHSELLKEFTVRDFAEMWPERFNNKTNGITHRRWLLVCNPGLSNLITSKIGDGWIKDFDQLKKLEPFAEDRAFRTEFMKVKRQNKERLANIIQDLVGEWIDPDSMFDVQIKRLHEYKRQLLNAMHIIALYHRIKDDPNADITPRTFIFGAKAAPSYHLAKLIIKLCNSLGRTINNDPDVADRLKVIFIPDYSVSLAEIIIPAADLSEQISTAGKEASGTGNMKLSLNGALTIGTLDGANVEIAEEVGDENIFIFGHKTHELIELKKTYNPWDYYNRDPVLRRVINAIRDNEFVPEEGPLFTDIYRTLMEYGDQYFHLADFDLYVKAQADVSALYENQQEWARRAILNVARMSKFSSDRTIREYSDDIWGIKPCPITVPNGNAAEQFGPDAD